MKTAVETIKSHRTFRHFKSDRPLAAEEIQTIIDCARQAPSWMNGQHYTIINITSPFGEARETLPYREKFARYYSSAEPKNEPLIYRQGWLVPHRDEKI